MTMKNGIFFWAMAAALLSGVGCERFHQFQTNEREKNARPYSDLKLASENPNLLSGLRPPKIKDLNSTAGKNLFNGRDLTGWKETDYAGRGKVEVKGGELHIHNGLVITGVTLTNVTVMPKTNYELSYEAKKVNGSDFFALLTFPVGDSHASFVNGGWGGAVTGISSINSMDASENDTTVYLKYNPNQWYRYRLRVTPDNISVWMDPKEHLIPLNATVASIVKAYQADANQTGRSLTAKQAEAELRKINPELNKNIPARDTIYFPGEAQIIDENIKDKVISIRPGEIELSAPLGFATFQSYGVIRNVRLRKLPTSAKAYDDNKTKPANPDVPPLPDIPKKTDD
ncbi:MAG: hypothetical protein CMO78_00250 [Verrucomicrobiales bacterium]|nr:hypothetical protein [Verrucomicrobiales bacterium]